MRRLPPALAASATPRVLELLGDPPGHVLELGFGGIHALPLRLAGFDAVVAPAWLDIGAIDAAKTLLIEGDGSVSVVE